MTNGTRITVIGATGRIGIELVKRLSAASIPTIAVTRDLSKAIPMPAVQWEKADISEPASLKPVLEQSRGVFLLSGHSPRFVEDQKNVIDAAKQFGVTHLVKLSSGAVDKDSPFYIPGSIIGQVHGEVEQLLKSSGLEWTILQPNGFMQNWLGDFAATVKAERKIYEAAGEGKRAYIDLRDISEVAFKVLADPGEHLGKTYLLTGSEAVNFHQVAAVIGDQVGEQVEFISLDQGQARARLEKKGVPETAIQSIIAYSQAQKDGKTSYISDAVPKILGRNARSVKVFVADHIGYFK